MSREKYTAKGRRIIWRKERTNNIENRGEDTEGKEKEIRLIEKEFKWVQEETQTQWR